jgi:hypothetical protein
MSFRHVVMFKWADDVAAGHAEETAAGLDRLPGVIDVIRTFRHGSDAGINEGNFDYVVVADFDSADDYVTYRDHPEHKAFVGSFIAGHVANRAAVQYSIAD